MIVYETRQPRALRGMSRMIGPNSSKQKGAGLFGSASNWLKDKANQAQQAAQQAQQMANQAQQAAQNYANQAQQIANQGQQMVNQAQSLSKQDLLNYAQEAAGQYMGQGKGFNERFGKMSFDKPRDMITKPVGRIGVVKQKDFFV